MTSYQSLVAAVIVSGVLSAILSFVIHRPLQALLLKVCPGEEAVRFWARFSLTMLFLSPLLVSIVFGVPSGQQGPGLESGFVAQQIIATSLFGAFLAMLGMGVWVSALISRAPRQRASAE
jgi:hypothetical protein